MRQRKNSGFRKETVEEHRTGDRPFVIPGVLTHRGRRAELLCIYCFVGRGGGELTLERDRRPLIVRNFFENRYDATKGEEGTALTRCMNCDFEIVFDAVVANVANSRLEVLERRDPRVDSVSLNVKEHGGANAEVHLKDGYVISMVPTKWLGPSDGINIRIYKPGEIKAGGLGVGFEGGQFVDAETSAGAMNSIDDVFKVIDMVSPRRNRGGR